MLSEVLMMHFVGPSNRFQINGIRFPEHFEALVYKDVVHQEISETINGDPQPDPEKKVKSLVNPEQKAQDPGCGEDGKEIVIFFKKITVITLVVVVM